MFSRVKGFIGQENLDKIKKSTIAVFGLGGVGGYTVEALVRSGVENIYIFDSDKVDYSNLNRQIIATVDTVGEDKVSVMKKRILSINPSAKVEINSTFILPENIGAIDFSAFDYVVDAIDTVSTKIALIKVAKDNDVPIISCMGTGGKLDATLLKVADIAKTSVCPLARVMRKELKDRQISGVKVVYSTEENISDGNFIGNKADGKRAPASMIFVPATAGLMLAREVILDIINQD